MNYKNLDIKIFDKYSCSIMHKEFLFSYTDPDSVVQDKYKGLYSNFGGLQCNFEPESKEYKCLYDYLLNVSQKVLKSIYHE